MSAKRREAAEAEADALQTQVTLKEVEIERLEEALAALQRKKSAEGSESEAALSRQLAAAVAKFSAHALDKTSLLRRHKLPPNNRPVCV